MLALLVPALKVYARSYTFREERQEGYRLMIGQSFGRLTVLAQSHKDRHDTHWACRCSCGVEKKVRGSRLRSGHTTSCGCYRREAAAKQSRVHAGTGTRAHKTWMGMIERCHSPCHKDYPRYGAKGVKVCDRWRESFAAFLADMGAPKAGQSIDRIDGREGYSPANCRWATPKQQARNRRTNVFIEHEGERLCIAEWSERVGISTAAMRRRLKHWPLPIALSLPGDAHRRVEARPGC